jgi:hypothetical protein
MSAAIAVRALDGLRQVPPTPPTEEVSRNGMSKQDQHEAVAEAVRLREEACISQAAAEIEAGTALRTWFAATASRRPLAYAVYLAALERQEAAVHYVERLSALVGAGVQTGATWMREPA